MEKRKYTNNTDSFLDLKRKKKDVNSFDFMNLPPDLQGIVFYSITLDMGSIASLPQVCKLFVTLFMARLTGILKASQEGLISSFARNASLYLRNLFIKEYRDEHVTSFFCGDAYSVNRITYTCARDYETPEVIRSVIDFQRRPENQQLTVNFNTREHFRNNFKERTPDVLHLLFILDEQTAIEIGRFMRFSSCKRLIKYNIPRYQESLQAPLIWMSGYFPSEHHMGKESSSYIISFDVKLLTQDLVENYWDITSPLRPRLFFLEK